MGYLELILQIADGAQAAYRNARVFFAHIISQKAAETVHLNILHIFCNAFQLRNALFDGKNRVLAAVVKHGYNHLVKYLRGAYNDIKMPVGGGVKSTGVNCCVLHIASLFYYNNSMNKNPLSDEIYLQRSRPQPPDIRGEYFRDQTKIIHSQPFRRLKSKTQVFSSPDNDHICTRIEHVMHVATIAVTICKGLNKSGNWRLDEEMAYAIGLAHDLGHAPFGHEGERALSAKIAPDRFMHEINGYRVVEHLTNYGEGLNLTYAVKDGLICHCGEDFSNNSLRPSPVLNDLEKIKDRSHFPTTYEGCIVRLADKIAYLGRDIEDAVRERLITFADVPPVIKSELGTSNGEIINTLVLDLADNSKNSDAIGFSPAKFALINEIKNFNYKYIYNHPSIATQRNLLHQAIHGLFYYYLHLFEKYGFTDAYQYEIKTAAHAFGHYVQAMRHVYKGDTALAKLIVTDYIAGMTDTFAAQAAAQATGIKLKFN